MHIKQVIISGFRSFRNQCEIEPFSPQHNVIVGRNGSGKSNFFDAIQFVLLGPRFASLRQEDRQHLLHEGAGTSVMAAYVEIVFDNVDGRMPIDGDEVVLRRTVGQKKDEFFINRKRCQKSEVVSLLESAGFSKSNPYYIVQQGKVANLCVMKDKDRLNLLREVAGTTVYEERRIESLRILQETNSKEERIDEVITFIKERLDELDKEKDELKEYEQLDKNRRALEYNIYDKELSKSKDQLTEMENARDGQREKYQEIYSQLQEIQDKIQAHDDNLKSLVESMDRLEASKVSKVEELNDISKQRSTLEAELQEVEASYRAKKVEQEQMDIAYKEVLQSITEYEGKLARVEPEYVAKNEELAANNSELKAIKTREDVLYGKQGRGRSFTTVEERDEFLQKQIDSFESQAKEKHNLLQRLEREIKDAEKNYDSDVKAISKAEQDTQNKLKRIGEVNISIKEKISQRNELQEQRKAGWHELERLENDISESRTELERGKSALNSSMPRSVTHGISAVMKIVQEKQLDGYYGPVIDNLTLRNPAFRTAVEVAAGNALFHVIVRDDEIAAMLMKELEKNKAGRVTFLPLNRLRVEDIVYPESNDIRPLINVAIDFDKEVEIAMKQVFGKKLLARDLETAAHFSREYSFDAITKDGDVVNRKGGFEGGYRDDRISKMLAVYKMNEASKKLEELKIEETYIKEKSDQVEQSVNAVLRELHHLEAEREHLKSNIDQQTRDATSRKSNLVPQQSQIDSRKKGLEALRNEINDIDAIINEYKDEKGSPLLDALSDKDRGELRVLNARENELITSSKTLEVTLIQIASERDTLKAHLNDYLLKRKDDLALKISTQSAGVDLDSKVANFKSEQKHLNVLSSVVMKDVADIEAAYEAKSKEKKNVETELENLRLKEKSEQDLMNEATKNNDVMLNKRSILLENVREKQRLIRDLGTLPRKELDNFKTLSEKDLLKNLRDVNESLKKYASVNRKALDQYINFSEQRDTLEDRKQEIERDRQSIKTLLTNLDQQKEEAILRTFKGVSHYFSEVFRELVPGGEGVLIMKTTDEIDSGADQADDEEGGITPVPTIEEGETISKFVGIQVRVSFSGSSQQYEMQQLSGGQKALVALALIFAIQKCDPAPFYLFDEVDQALDANYRAGVARLIQKQAESEDAPAQFITTTFRPELVAVSHKQYGIALQNKVSNIYALEKEEAMSFVENLMVEEEAVGNVTAIPSYRQQQKVSSSSSQRSPSRVAGDEENVSPQPSKSGASRAAVMRIGKTINESDEEDSESSSDGEDHGEDSDSGVDMGPRRDSKGYKRTRASKRLAKLSVDDYSD